MGLLDEISGKDHILDAKKHLLLKFEEDINKRAMKVYSKMIDSIKDDASKLRFKNENGKKVIEDYEALWFDLDCFSSVKKDCLKLATKHKEFFVNDPDFKHFMDIFPYDSKSIDLRFRDEDFSYRLEVVESKKLGCFKMKFVPTRWAIILMQKLSELCKDDGIQLTFGVRKIASDKFYEFEKPYLFVKGRQHLNFEVKYRIIYD